MLPRIYCNSSGQISGPDITVTTQKETIDCVLLADRHHGLSEGVRGLLEAIAEVIVMVADEKSLLEGAKRLSAALAVVDLSLVREDAIGLLRRLRRQCPALKIIALSVHDEVSVSQSILAAGAEGFVLKRSIATDLLAAVDAVRAGRRFVSPGVLKQLQ